MSIRAILKNILAGFLITLSFLIVFTAFLYQPLDHFILNLL